MTPPDAEPIEHVRVGRFEWERLMMSSPLPRPTKTILVMLAMFMSEDGGDARPGRDAMETVTGRDKSVISKHLRAAVDAGYLIEVERGGFRQHGGARASEYAASVPKRVHETREAILSAPPWRRDWSTRTSGKHDVRVTGERRKNTRLVGDEGCVSGDEGRVFGDERRKNTTPPRTNTTHPHHPEPKSGEGDGSEAPGQNPDVDYVREVQGLRPDWTARLILEAISKAEQDGRNPAHCREALLRLARGEHGDTKLPSRLIAAGPWWEAVIPRPTIVRSGKCPKHPDRFADCGKCAQEKPRCDHGVISGTEPFKAGGSPRCALCRAQSRKAEAA